MNDIRSPMNDRPKLKTQGQLLLELIAISGEYPANNINRLIPAASYAKKVVTSLTADNLLKTVNSGGLKGYRLTLASKRKLAADNPARFVGVLDGTSETNKMRSGYERRLRLHSIAETCTLMHNVGAEIFQDMKPKVYLLNEADSRNENSLRSAPNLPSQPNGSPKQKGVGGNAASTITTPCFYTSREQKGQNDNAVRGSRAVGTLLTPTDVYAVYNTGGTESRWSKDVELRFKVEVQDNICRKLLAHQYGGEAVNGIMVGNDLETLEKYLEIKPKHQTGFHFLIKTFPAFYYITNDKHGEAQLRFLCNEAKMNELDISLQKKLSPSDKKYPVEHDAITTDSNPVLFCYLLNVPRLVRFKNGVTLHKKIGKIVAFDFQVEMLMRYLGDTAEVIKAIDFEKFVGWIYPERVGGYK